LDWAEIREARNHAPGERVDGIKMKRVQAALTAITLAATLTPAIALADTAVPGSYDLATRQTDIYAAGEYDGRLRIRVSADGIVAGTFMDTEGNISSVAGGLDGTKIWIDLRAGSPGTLRVFNGTFADGKLVATASRGLHRWQLEGTPVAR
jgi:hypothetical protein